VREYRGYPRRSMVFRVGLFSFGRTNCILLDDGHTKGFFLSRWRAKQEAVMSAHWTYVELLAEREMSYGHDRTGNPKAMTKMLILSHDAAW
jgi:hypothetical protein